MSEVISFRLDRGNPKEAQALEILVAWCSRGYSVSYVMTEAILKLSVTSSERIANNPYEIKSILEQVNQVLNQLGNCNLSPLQNGIIFGVAQL